MKDDSHPGCHGRRASSLSSEEIRKKLFHRQERQERQGFDNQNSSLCFLSSLWFENEKRVCA